MCMRCMYVCMYVTVTKGLEGLKGFTGRDRDRETYPSRGIQKKGPNTKM